MSNVRRIETSSMTTQDSQLRSQRENLIKPTEGPYRNYAHIADIAVKDALNTVQNIRRDFKNSFPSSIQPELTTGHMINFVKVEEAFVNLTRNLKLPNETNQLVNEAKKRSFKIFSTNFKAKYTPYEIIQVNFTPSENKQMSDPTLRPGLPLIKTNYDNKEYLNTKRVASTLECDEPKKKSKVDQCSPGNKSSTTKDQGSTKAFEFPHSTSTSFSRSINLEDSSSAYSKEEKMPTICNSFFNNQQNIHLNMNVTNIFIGKKNKDIFLLEDIKQLLLQTQNKYQEIHDSLTKKTLSFSIQNQSNVTTQFTLLINKDTHKIEKYEKILNDGKRSSIDCTMGEDEEKMVSDQLESIKFELKKKIKQL